MQAALIMTSTQEYLRKRETELLEQLQPYADVLRELAEVRQAMRSIGIASENSHLCAPFAVRPTIKIMITTAFRDHCPEGATMPDLRNFLRDVWGYDIPLNTLRPQFHRLAKDGVVKHTGEDWKLSA